MVLHRPKMISFELRIHLDFWYIIVIISTVSKVHLFIGFVASVCIYLLCLSKQIRLDIVSQVLSQTKIGLNSDDMSYLFLRMEKYGNIVNLHLYNFV